MEASVTILFLAFIVGATIFWVWALVDVLRRGSSAEYRTGTQLLWAVIIAFSHSIGALAYVVFGRPRSEEQAAAR